MGAPTAASRGPALGVAACLALGACRDGGAPPAGGWFYGEVGGEPVTAVVETGPRRGCAGGGPRVGLWGPHFATRGLVPAEVEAPEDGSGARWLHFPLLTGPGEAEAAMRVEGGEARLPFGGRPGEFEVALARGEAPEDAEARLEGLDAEAAARLAADREGWARGELALLDGGALVGDLRFRAELPPLVAVYDAWWLTPEPVPADRFDDGGDVVLVFEAEPSLEGEEASLRLDVALMRAVVPSGPLPEPEDRRLDAALRSVDEATRETAVARARREADAAERAWIADLGRRLAREAWTGAGCRPWAEAGPDWRLVLRGYEVEISPLAPGEPGAPGCAVTVEPTVPQHRRRFRGRVGPAGIPEGGETCAAAAAGSGRDAPVGALSG